jgi:hypothetical protein
MLNSHTFIQKNLTSPELQLLFNIRNSINNVRKILQTIIHRYKVLVYFCEIYIQTTLVLEKR